MFPRILLVQLSRQRCQFRLLLQNILFPFNHHNTITKPTSLFFSNTTVFYCRFVYIFLSACSGCAICRPPAPALCHRAECHGLHGALSPGTEEGWGGWHVRHSSSPRPPGVGLPAGGRVFGAGRELLQDVHLQAGLSDDHRADRHRARRVCEEGRRG